ncbi:MAG: restriction endonuclease subunit M [Lachnospiraceae bacterium]|nr:restriction endonuclease subunit M [Lachnospiraceae bacterium]
MDIERLKLLVSQFQKSRDYYHDAKNAYNEQSCRDEYISPLLECFGWDVQNAKGKEPQYREVRVEKVTRKTDRIDYTLTLNGVDKIFIEAKKPLVDITRDPEPARQTRRYGYNAKHSISILTNFENLIIYDVTYEPKETDDARVALYKCYNYLEYVKKFDEIARILLRDNVYNGNFDDLVNSEFLTDTRDRVQVDRLFLKLINGWRKDIGVYLYSKDEKYHDEEVLNDTVQTFINQVIFLRICEDNNLPLYQNLRKVAEDKAHLNTELHALISAADRRYNSGLFKSDDAILDLSVEAIWNVIDSIYYPKSPYLFNVIEPSLLGKIYEAYLTQKLVINSRRHKVDLGNKEEYEYRSVVTTPVEIVKSMVRLALAPLCEGKTPEEIKQLRIADIACGSGVFLVETFQYLVDCTTNWYLKNNPAHLLEKENGEKGIPFIEKKELLVNSIYGVDIDPHAVETAKFSLLVKLLEKETEPTISTEVPALPDLANNIRHGNSLVERADIRRSTLNKVLAIVPFDWSGINDGNKFDIIIGNPPYVKTEDMRKLATKYEYDIYLDKYKSAYKQFDKYYLFIERAMGLLKPTGKLCYIVPNKFFTLPAASKLRAIIGGQIEHIADFGEKQLFEDKTIYSAVILLTQSGCVSTVYKKYSSSRELWLETCTEETELDTSILGEDPWMFSTDNQVDDILEAIDGRTVPLSEVATLFNGIQTSAERAEKFSDKKEVYWFSSDVIKGETPDTYRIEKYGKEYTIEKAILKPYFKPTKQSEKGMDSYSVLQTDKLIIFPYNTDGTLISIATMRSDYPGTFAYLTDCYDRLIPKVLSRRNQGRDVKDATADTWYKYGRTQALTSFINTPKLIVKVLCKDQPMYAYDDNDFLIASGGTAGYCAISAKEDSEYCLEYIQAWLSHPYTEQVVRLRGSIFEGGFVSRGTNVLSNLPFVKLDFTESNQKKLYDVVVKNTRKVYEINKRIISTNDKAKIKILSEEKLVLIGLIEEAITKVYKKDF